MPKCDASYLAVLYRTLCRQAPGEGLDEGNFAQRTGIVELSGDLLGVMEGRLLMHRVYAGERDKRGYLIGGFF